jgi:hypothetical protein
MTDSTTLEPAEIGPKKEGTAALAEIVEETIGDCSSG